MGLGTRVPKGINFACCKTMWLPKGQGDVPRHVGAEGDTKVACHKAMWLSTGGAEGNTKLACRKAMWNFWGLGLLYFCIGVDLGPEGWGIWYANWFGKKWYRSRRVMAVCRRHRSHRMMMVAWVPKGTEEGESDRSLLCRFPQTAPNC
ncbi:unnamed protein product [Prunus brigantina]